MTICNGCARIIFFFSPRMVMEVPMDRDYIKLEFHVRCHDSYAMGLATGIHNDRAHEIVQEILNENNN